MAFLVFFLTATLFGMAGEQDGFIPAGSERVRKVSGVWTAQSYRGASRGFLATTADNAAIELEFTGTGLVVVLGSHALPFTNLGSENLGTLAVDIDGKPAAIVRPQHEDRDVVVARNLSMGKHLVRLQHHSSAAGTGVKLTGFRVLKGGEGELSFLVHGEANRFLTDIRAILYKDGRIVRDELARNWLTGQCRIAGVPSGSGYLIELRASGWETQTLTDLRIETDRDTVLPPVFLHRTPQSTLSGVEYPHAGKPAILQAGGAFATRFSLEGTTGLTVRLERRAGPAVISRSLSWVEDKARAYDGRSEGTLTVPSDTPPGLYDLIFNGTTARSRKRFASRAVHVVPAFPKDPVFVTFGHLDTWGQEQAEYLERIADVSNLIAPDMVLVSNEVNAAYDAGAFSRLDMPYLITFGNHRVSGHEEWYGRPASIVDFGPNLSILNYSYAWHGDMSAAYTLLESRSQASCRLINAFESDAPLDLLDRFRIPYLHDAHGEGPRVTRWGSTPTQRAGKENSSSFRVVRFEGCRPVSFTYAGHPTAPIPFSRTAPSPLRVSYQPASDGTHRTVTATLVNEWKQAFPRARIVFVMPRGEYLSDKGDIESAIPSDDGRFVVVSVRLDAQPGSSLSVTLAPRT
jgi:hypothetical protein